MILVMSDQESLDLFESWMKLDPELTKEVMSQNYCDIEPSFMCFADVYESLAKLIPKHWTVVDFGCAFAPQCLYFKDHEKYIGVDPGRMKRFYTENFSLYESTIIEWFTASQIYALNLDRSFAILSYVPADEYSYFLVKTHFKNLFVYYPHGESIKLKK